MGWNDIETTREGGNETPYTKFEQGNSKIRILDEAPHSHWSHFFKKQRLSCTCPGKDCPICTVIKNAKDEKRDIGISNSKRHAMRIWNYETDRMEIMIQGKTFFSNLLTLHKEVGDVRGYDIKIIRSGSDLSTTYTLLPTAVSDFAFADKVTDVDLEKQFEPHDKVVMMQLLEGKTYKDIFGSDEEAAAGE